MTTPAYGLHFLLLSGSLQGKMAFRLAEKISIKNADNAKSSIFILRVAPFLRTWLYKEQWVDFAFFLQTGSSKGAKVN